MARVKMTTAEAQALRSRPVAKGKGIRKARQAERELEGKVGPVRVRKSEQPIRSENNVSAKSLKGLVGETMARCYAEIFPGMKTHDEFGIVDREIEEEAYILSLTIMVGNDNDLPRTGLKMREDGKASSTMKTCRSCEGG